LTLYHFVPLIWWSRTKKENKVKGGHGKRKKDRELTRAGKSLEK